MTFSSKDLCGPNPNPMTWNEVVALKHVMSQLPEEPVVVQIGAERGTSTLAMLEERPDSFIFSIDTRVCEVEYDNLRKAKLDAKRVVRVLGRSQDIGEYWPFLYHLLFIDGDHSETGVRGDILAWKDNVMPDGFIAFHDYIPEPIPSEIKGRVVYAVDDLMKDYEVFLWIERLKVFIQR